MPTTLNPPATGSPAHAAVPPPAGIAQLGRFLRARRESLAAAPLGLARYGRVRTPGLRREEVAQLAGIGVTWYTKLEQGRDVRPSRQALVAIAKALQCSDDEVQHVLALAGLHTEARLAPQPGDCPFPEGHGLLLRKLLPYPALLQNSALDIVACNAAYEALMGIHLAKMAEVERNCLHQALFNPEWGRLLVREADTVQHLVAMFRAGSTRHAQDPAWQARLYHFMANSAAFRDAWERYQVHSPENRDKTFQHPTLGTIRLRQTNWWSAPRNDRRLMVYLPLSDEAAAALDRLLAAPR